MRNQQPGLPQPWLRQQTGVSDVQLRQQHFLYKQIQELQRQQQLQQLDQEARQQNSLNPLSAVVKQAPSGQLSSLVNGAPLQDASNHMWAGKSGGGDSRIPSTSQMHMVGNANWVHRTVPPAMQGFPNGLMSSKEQNQALRSVSFGSQQLDQSLYGAPVATTRGALNQYSHFHGNSNDGIDMLTKASDNQVDKTIVQTAAFNVFQNDQAAVLPNQVCVSDGVSVSNQGFQGKNLFGHVPVSTLHNGVISENFQQMNSLSRNVQLQEFHDGQGPQVSWEGNLQEKEAAQVETSQGFVALDPTEAKILFNTDEGFWDNSLGKIGGMSGGGCVSGNQLEGNDYLNSFPSVNSGSWSALMQSAVAEASSGDTGLQDEWSTLSFQKTELSNENRATLNDSGKQPVNWVHNDLQTASSLTSRPFPLFDDSNMSLNGHCVTNFRQNASHESLQQSPKETSKWLDQSSQHKALIGGSFQVQMPMHLDNTQESAWGSQIYEQSRGSEQSANMELNSRNKQSPWAHQQSMTSYSFNNQSSIKQNGWNINESLSPNEDAAMKILDNENAGQHPQNNEARGGTHLESDNSQMGRSDDNIVAISFPNSTGGFKPVKSGASSPHTNPYINNFSSLPNSSTFKMNQEMNQQVQHGHNLDYRKQAMSDSSFYRNSENVGKHRHQSSQCLNVQESSISTSDRTSGESYGKKRESYQKEVSDSYDISGHSRTQHSTVGDGLRENACSVAMDTRRMVSGNQKSDGQVSRKSTGSLKFQHHPMGNLGVHMEFSETTKHVAHTQDESQLVIRGLKSQEQGYFVQSKSVGHAVSNIGMDIGKGYLTDVQRNANRVDELPSRSVHPGYESSVSAPFDRSTAFYTPNEQTMRASQNMLELLHKVDQSKENIVTGSLSDRNSSEMPEASAADGSAAQLHHSQSSGSQGFGLRLAPPQHPSASNHGLPSQTSSQTTDDLNSMHDQEGNSFGTVTPSISFPRNQLQQQHVTSSSGQSTNQFLNLSFASQTDMGVQSKLASHFRLMHDSHDGAEQSAQASFSGDATRTLPFNLCPTADACSPFVQSYSSSAVHSQPTNVNSSYLRGSSQQLPVSQLPVTSGTSHGGFSSAFQNAWANATSQQLLSGGLSGKVPLFPSIRPSTSSLEAASWTLQRSDDLGMGKGGNGPFEIGTRSTNSELFTQGDDQPGKDGSLRQLPHGSMAQETAGSVQVQETVVHPLQRNLGRGMPGQEYSLISQAEHASPRNTENSNNEIGPFVHSLRSSGDTHRGYSLLHQMNAMKGVDPDSCRVTKRFRGADFGVDARESVTMTGSRFAYGPTTMARNPVENTSQLVHFPSSDSKMLCFSSEVKEDRNAIASHFHVGGAPSKDMAMFGRNGPQNYSSPLMGTSGNSFRGNEHPHIDPQMAPSWLERHGTDENGQILPMHEGVDGFRRDAKLAAQHFFFGKVSEASHAHTKMEQANVGNASQTGSIWQSPVDTLPDNEHLLLPPSLPLDQDLIAARANKRKSATSALIPWHKEVIECSQKLQNISLAELDWAQATNRLTEKVEDEADMVEDGPAMPRSRRRLILTTQLMQQLLRAIPAAILSADATSEYESAAYLSAKLALGDACSWNSGSGSDSHVRSNCGTMISGNVKASKRPGDQFLKFMEGFINRGRKLENDLMRLEKGASILDIRIESQDLEKISVINRFARFHGRGNAEGVESSSSSELTDQKSYPLRYVTAVPVPRDLPEEVSCLSL